MNMKNIKMTVLVATTLLLINITGCKARCYQCYSFFGYVDVSKNRDTIYSSGIGSSTMLHDTINYYVSLGYKVDTVAGIYGYDNLASGCDQISPTKYDSCVRLK
jgi:hypothetical protein